MQELQPGDLLATLPPPVQTYFDASNRHDPDAITAAFASDAVVLDEGRELTDPASIRRWADETIDHYHPVATPIAVAGDGDALTVTCEVSGDFPGSPAQIRFAFRLRSGQIVRLEVK